jgi:hypothetical protein
MGGTAVQPSAEEIPVFFAGAVCGQYTEHCADVRLYSPHPGVVTTRRTNKQTELSGTITTAVNFTVFGVVISILIITKLLSLVVFLAWAVLVVVPVVVERLAVRALITTPIPFRHTVLSCRYKLSGSIMKLAIFLVVVTNAMMTGTAMMNDCNPALQSSDSSADSAVLAGRSRSWTIIISSSSSNSSSRRSRSSGRNGDTGCCAERLQVR